MHPRSGIDSEAWSIVAHGWFLEPELLSFPNGGGATQNSQTAVSIAFVDKVGELTDPIKMKIIADDWKKILVDERIMLCNETNFSNNPRIKFTHARDDYLDKHKSNIEKKFY